MSFDDGGAAPIITITIKEAEECQAIDIVELGEKIFSNPWNEENVMASIFGTYDKVMVAMEGDGDGQALVGYIIYSAPCEDCDLLRIAVREDVRGRGVATQLMQYMVYDLKKNGHESIMLEVRESNEKAIALDEKFDFDEISRRKDYYRDPKEDAVVMKKYLE